MAVPALLYHYCSMESFLSIINSGVIRLSDSRCTNDAYENVWIMKPVRDVLDNAKQSNEKLVLELEKYITGIGRKPVPYIACFSEMGDLLSQWRAYGDDGKGVAIGFEVKISEGLPVTYEGMQGVNDSLKIRNVVYDYDVQRKLVDEIIHNALQDVFTNVPSWVNSLKLLSYVYKHPAFREEKEWRIIHTPLIYDNYMMDGGISALKFSTKRDTLASFFELPVTAIGNFVAIKEIVLGPKNRTLPDILHDFLEMRYYPGVIIRRSEVPYR